MASSKLRRRVPAGVIKSGTRVLATSWFRTERGVHRVKVVLSQADAAEALAAVSGEGEAAAEEKVDGRHTAPTLSGSSLDAHPQSSRLIGCWWLCAGWAGGAEGAVLVGWVSATKANGTPLLDPL